MSSAIPATPKLIPVFKLTAQLQGPPQALFMNETSKSVSTMVIVEGGDVSTIENDLGFEAKLANLGGYDNITIYSEKGYSELDACLCGKTPEGEDVKISVSGTLKSLPGLDAVLAGQATSHSFDDSYLSNTPRFDFGGKVPEKLRWIEKENLVGKGHLFVEDGKMYVQYFYYVIR